MEPHTHFPQQLVSKMQNQFTKPRARKSHSARRGRRLSELTFGESRSHFKMAPKNTLEKTEENFPSLGNCKEQSDEKIIYSVKALFEKRRNAKNKKKKNPIAPGWIRLYFQNGKICQQYGPPPLEPPPDYTNYFQEEALKKYLLRVEEYEYLQDNEFILPHISEFVPINQELDYSTSDDEFDSEQEFYSDDDEFLSDY